MNWRRGLPELPEQLVLPKALAEALVRYLMTKPAGEVWQLLRFIEAQAEQAKINDPPPARS